MLEFLASELQVESVLHLHVDEASREQHQMVSVGVGIVLGHLGTLVLKHAADVAEGARYHYHGTVAVDDVRVRVHVVTRDLRLTAHRTINRQLWTHEHMVMCQLRDHNLDLTMLASLQAQRTLVHVFLQLNAHYLTFAFIRAIDLLVFALFQVTLQLSELAKPFARAIIACDCQREHFAFDRVVLEYVVAPCVVHWAPEVPVSPSNGLEACGAQSMAAFGL